MNKVRTSSKLFTLLTLLAFLGLGVHLTAGSQQAQSPSIPQKATPAASSGGDGDYVGSDTCVTCHQDQERRFKNTIMGRIMQRPRNALESRGCESCHGPGRSHVEAGGGKETIPIRFGKDSRNSVAEQNAVCEECHSRGAHMFLLLQGVCRFVQDLSAVKWSYRPLHAI